MTTQTEALKLARRAINNLIASSHLTDPQPWRDARQDSVDALVLIEEALAQPEQEPVAYQDIAKPTELVAAEDWDNIDPQWHWMYQPLYTTPPQRKPLTREQRIQIVKDNTIQGYHGDYFDAWGIIDDVEAAHGIKE